MNKLLGLIFYVIVNLFDFKSCASLSSNNSLSYNNFRLNKTVDESVIPITVLSSLSKSSDSLLLLSYSTNSLNHRIYRSKFNIEDILYTYFPLKISDDIDMDPCKSDNFMGDIALPNINYEIQWQTQKLNKSFQEEIENIKKEVYHEGLQVEEEGMTDILRKKTKQPIDNYGEEIFNVNNKNYNDPMQTGDDTINPKPLKGTHINLANSYENRENSNEDEIINATIIESTIAVVDENLITTTTETTIDLHNKRHNTLVTSQSGVSYHLEGNKIQSDQKNITDETGTNIHLPKKVKISPTSLPATRSTLPNRFSNNRATLDNAQFVSGDGVVRQRHSHRRRRQGRKQGSSNEQKSDNYQLRLSRLKSELNRAADSQVDSKLQNKSLSKKSVEDDIIDEEFENILTKKKATLDVAELELTTMKNINMMDQFQNGEHLKIHEHHRATRAATAKKERIWDYGVIPYEIDGNFSGGHKALFKQAMRHWENFTCIKFVERNAVDHPNYIVFTERPCGCCSFVGKRGNGAQAISIGKNCDKFGIVVHELGHVVGFWHEHTRPDRENHVVIEKNNIMQGQEYNFNKLTEDEVNSLGLPYDYDSIMHYARNTFSKGTYLDTILPIEMKHKKRPEIGQRIKLSEGDIAQANLLYKCPKCGKTFQDNTGLFNSPYYFTSSQLADPERCEWRITATHGERIVLNVTDLDIFKSNNCRSDYIEIRDGYWHKSPVLGKFCGSGRINELIKSTGSRMLVSYVTNSRQFGHRGFAASYEAVCGGEVDLETGGRLESPNYPLDYLPNKECIWKITVPENYQVALRFQSFDVENHDSCAYDYVEVRDGETQDSRLIGVFCGYKVPPDITSTSNKLFVKFVSDGSVQKAGFSATFMKEVDECEVFNHGCAHDCINTLGGYECACKIGYELHSDKKNCEDACGGLIEQLNGTITSPSFPEMYPLSKYCVWEITAPPQYRITLNFTHFELEGNNVHQQECEYDSLTVFSKMSEDNLKKHGVFCGNRQIPLITSEGNVLRVEFSSDTSVQKSGFAAVFFTDIDECADNNGNCQHECKNTIGSYTCSCHNGYTLHDNEHDCKEGGCKYEITSPNGQIYSPNYPEYYPAKKDCVWHFSTTPGHRIRLSFLYFEMEPHQECAYDHIAIYDGDSTESHTLGRFCGSKSPHPISSNTNEMYMVFKSDASVQRKGFVAMHGTSCGGRLQATNRVKHFYSHAKYGDLNYENADCDWTIEAESGKNVQLTFLTFDLEAEASCSYDYVEVYGGLDDASGPLYGKFCGNVNPSDIISMNEALLIRFRTDETMFFKGFSASYVSLNPLQSEEIGSESLEYNTPFPGSLNFMNKFDEDDDDDDENNSNSNKIRYDKSSLL